MKKRSVRRLLSWFLVIALSLIPLQSQASAETALNNEAESIASRLTSLAELDTIMTEELSMREESVKVYSIGSNGYIAAVYNDPVHYQDASGQWREIDNRLTAVTAETTNGDSAAYYRNTASPLTVQFPASLTAETPLRIAIGELELGMALQSAVEGLETAQAAKTIGAAFQAQTPAQSPLPEQLVMAEEAAAQIQARLPQEEKLAEVNALLAAEADPEARLEILRNAKMELDHQKSVVDYEDVLPGVTLQYVLHGDELKENLILSQAPSQTAYTFALTFSGYTARLQEDGAVFFHKIGENGAEAEEPAAVIPAPYMFDALDNMNFDIAVELEPTPTGALYRLIPDGDWLQDPERQYPVTIDPAVKDSRTTSTLATDIIDNGVMESDPTTVYYTTNRFYVGSHVSGGKAYAAWTYIQLPRISAISTSDFILSAELTLTHYPTASWQTAVNNIYQIFSTSSWDATTLCWNNKPAATGSLQGVIYSTTKDQPLSNDKASITKLARTWYSSSTAACRFVIKPQEVRLNATNRTCYYSSDCGSADQAKRPQMSVVFYKGSQTTGITNNEIYSLRNSYCGQYLDVPNAGGSGSQLIQCKLNGGTNQQWRTEYCGGGVYRIVPQHNIALRLHIPNAQDTEGVNVEVYSVYDDGRQYFQIISNGDGTYRIQPLCSSTRVLSVRGPSTAELAKIELKTWTGASQMRWTFIPAFKNGVDYILSSADEDDPGYNSKTFSIRIANQKGLYTAHESDAIAAMNAWNAQAGTSITSNSSAVNSIIIEESGSGGQYVLGSYNADSKSNGRANRFTIRIYQKTIDTHPSFYSLTAEQKTTVYRNTIAHELGHALGLNDNPTGAASIMKYSYTPWSGYYPEPADAYGVRVYFRE